MGKTRRQIEWPTVVLVMAVYLVIGSLVWFHGALPWWLILPIGAYFAALHSSLQHEVLHGHPTGNRLLNETLIFLTPTFWLPFPRYRETHLTHHNDENLTDPRFDPESYYMLPDEWARLPGIKRILYNLNQTLAGRMAMGPAVSIIQFWTSDLARLIRGEKWIASAWLYHGLACAMSIFLISGVAGMPLWQYIALIAYPGISMALVRSFCEHQAAEKTDHRTIIVEASPFWSLLFLNNNLHVAHHTWPALAWYKLPGLYRTEREAIIGRNNGYLMRGYGEIFWRYFLKAKEPVPYPHPEWLRNP